jgi:hypothetical protein
VGNAKRCEESKQRRGRRRTGSTPGDCLSSEVYAFGFNREYRVCITTTWGIFFKIFYFCKVALVIYSLK